MHLVLTQFYIIEKKINEAQVKLYFPLSATRFLPVLSKVFFIYQLYATSNVISAFDVWRDSQ